MEEQAKRNAVKYIFEEEDEIFVRDMFIRMAAIPYGKIFLTGDVFAPHAENYHQVGQLLEELIPTNKYTQLFLYRKDSLGYNLATIYHADDVDKFSNQAVQLAYLLTDGFQLIRSMESKWKTRTLLAKNVNKLVENAKKLHYRNMIYCAYDGNSYIGFVSKKYFHELLQYVKHFGFKCKVWSE